MAAKKPTIKMDESVKEIRTTFLKHAYEHPENWPAIQAGTLSKVPLQERAEIVYRLHLAGFELGKLCPMFGISLGYQRQLRQLKEQEWATRLLTDDETFKQFKQTIEPKHYEYGTVGSKSIHVMFLLYIMAGIDINISEMRHLFDETIKEYTAMQEEQKKLDNQIVVVD